MTSTVLLMAVPLAKKVNMITFWWVVSGDICLKISEASEEVLNGVVHHPVWNFLLIPLPVLVEGIQIHTH